MREHAGQTKTPTVSLLKPVLDVGACSSGESLVLDSSNGLTNTELFIIACFDVA